MTRYVCLMNFTEKGIASLTSSVARAAAFREAAARVGGTVESQYWTIGAYDGVFVLNAPDEATAAALSLELGSGGHVRTCLLRAFDSEEFAGIVAKVS